MSGENCLGGGCVARGRGRAPPDHLRAVEHPSWRRNRRRGAIQRGFPALARRSPDELPPAARAPRQTSTTDHFSLLFFPTLPRRRGRTGVQLKDKWRNLIKFQHLRRGEAESAPHRTGGRGPGPGAKRKKADDG